MLQFAIKNWASVLKLQMSMVIGQILIALIQIAQIFQSRVKIAMLKCSLK